MNKISEIEIPESVHNHLSYINDIDGKIKFLELFFNIKLKWYQKLYLKINLSNYDYRQLYKLIQYLKNNKKR